MFIMPYTKSSKLHTKMFTYIYGNTLVNMNMDISSFSLKQFLFKYSFLFFEYRNLRVCVCVIYTICVNHDSGGHKKMSYPLGPVTEGSEPPCVN